MSAAWISTFLEAQAAELSAARNTILSYNRDLRDFAGWLGDRGFDLETADRKTIENYLVYCDTRGLAKSTRARRLSSMRRNMSARRHSILPRCNRIT